MVVLRHGRVANKGVEKEVRKGKNRNREILRCSDLHPKTHNNSRGGESPTARVVLFMKEPSRAAPGDDGSDSTMSVVAKEICTRNPSPQHAALQIDAPGKLLR